MALTPSQAEQVRLADAFVTELTETLRRQIADYEAAASVLAATDAELAPVAVDEYADMGALIGRAGPRQDPSKEIAAYRRAAAERLAQPVIRLHAAVWIAATAVQQAQNC